MFLRGRMMCSMEAMWRVMNYQTYPASTPPVSTIKLKAVAQLTVLKQDKKLCDIAVYFARSNILRDITYTEFYKLFDYITSCYSYRNSNLISDFLQVSFSMYI